MPGVWYKGFGQADERIKYWLENPPASVCIDLETIDLKERMPLGIGISPSPVEAFYCELYPEPNVKFLEAISPMLAKAQIVKVGSNLLFDLGVVPLVPVIGSIIDRFNIFDINVAARLKGFKYVDLTNLAQWELNKQHESMSTVWKHYGVKDNLELLQKTGSHEVLGSKCMEDVMLEHELYYKWRLEIHQKFGQYWATEMAVIPLLTDMSQKGIALDTEAVDGLCISYQKQVDELYGKIQTFGIENPGSPSQVGYILAKRGNFLKLTKSKKQLSTRNEELEFCTDPLAQLVLQYRHKNTFLTRYLLPIRGADRFYTEYYLDTDVGRLNSRNMNIQNIPPADAKTGDPGARFIMMPDSGLWVAGDYGKLHMYILANMAKDQGLMSILYNPDPSKQDIHQQTADMMGVSRKDAKVVNYAVIYGGTVETLMEQMRNRDRALASSLLDKWGRTFRTAWDWLHEAQREGMRSGWALPTLFGRRIKLPMDESENHIRNKAANYPILGSDGEIIKRALLLSARRGLRPPVLAITVHDSIDWDTKDEQKVYSIKEEIEHIPGFKVPFEVKSTFRWE